MARKVHQGRIVDAGRLAQVRLRLTRVVRSDEVQQRAKELAPAAQRLLSAVRREWRR